MPTSKAVLRRETETEGVAGLTKGQKIIGVCLLLFYLAMIGITIATLPYIANGESRAVSKERAAHFNQGGGPPALDLNFQEASRSIA